MQRKTLLMKRMSSFGQWKKLKCEAGGLTLDIDAARAWTQRCDREVESEEE